MQSKGTQRGFLRVIIPLITYAAGLVLEAFSYYQSLGEGTAAYLPPTMGSQALAVFVLFIVAEVSLGVGLMRLGLLGFLREEPKQRNVLVNVFIFAMMLYEGMSLALLGRAAAVWMAYVIAGLFFACTLGHWGGE